MIRALLLDLDDTLLSNDMDRFMPAYLKLLADYAADRYDPTLLVQHVLAAAGVMAANTDPAVSNEEVFWAEFSRLTGFDPAEMIPFFTRFYQTRFNDLQTLTEPRPEARPLVEYALRQGYAVVIATNPMFPRVAVERRLAWAGIDDFDYDLVTNYANMHFTKPHPGYYQEILERLDTSPAEALMAGDDWERDIVPAAGLGIKTFWIARPERELPSNDLPLAGRGTLTDLRAWLEGV